MVNHHFAPPFGRICWELFAKHHGQANQQIQYLGYILESIWKDLLFRLCGLNFFFVSKNGWEMIQMGVGFWKISWVHTNVSKFGCVSPEP